MALMNTSGFDRQGRCRVYYVTIAICDSATAQPNSGWLDILHREAAEYLEKIITEHEDTFAPNTIAVENTRDPITRETKFKFSIRGTRLFPTEPPKSQLPWDGWPLGQPE